MIEPIDGQNTNPLVSVIVATNRGGPYLEEALRSACEQSYENLEIILVDDGSPADDDLAPTIARFARVRLLRQAAAGVSVARNNGVAHSSGMLLVFLDDDDRWSPRRIARQVEAMLSTSAVVSYCGMRTIDHQGIEIVAASQRQVKDVHEILRRRTGIILPNLMIRRETFLRVGGFHPSFRRAQDLDLVLKAALEGDFTFVDEVLVDYRYHESNNTRRHRELCRSIDHIVRLHQWNAREAGRDDLVEDHRESLETNARFAAWSAARAARDLARKGRLAAAAGELAWAAGFAPIAPWSWARQRLGGRRKSR